MSKHAAPGTRGWRWWLDHLFIAGLWFKLLDGVIELVGGGLLLFLGPEQLQALIALSVREELSEDPQDLIANALQDYARGLNLSATLFVAVYLLAHGMVKVVLVIAVLRDRLWAYPWLIGFLALFIGYQCLELVRHFGYGLLLLTLFDVLIVWLTIREYRILRRGSHFHGHRRRHRHAFRRTSGA